MFCGIAPFKILWDSGFVITADGWSQIPVDEIFSVHDFHNVADCFILYMKDLLFFIKYNTHLRILHFFIKTEQPGQHESDHEGNYIYKQVNRKLFI